MPAGTVWSKVKRDGLWSKDGSHPSKLGVYLTACVFYATLFDESPEGAEFDGGLKPELAKEMQKAAAEGVKKR